MKKFSLLMTAVTLIASTHAASAADWKSDLQSAVANQKYNEIDVIAANNPNEQGAIASYLLTQAQIDSGASPEKAIKLFGSAATFADQIPASQAPAAGQTINTMLTLANNPDFQRNNRKGAGIIYTAALAMSSDPNIIVVNPNLHNVALANAGDFLSVDPNGDKQLTDEVNLALQVGSPPPLGPHGVRNPSLE